MASQSAPYTYPTPDMIAGVNQRGASPSGQGRAIDTSAMGAPQGVLSRFRNWLGVTILGADGANVFMPPQQPLQPIAQHPDQAGIGRPWDYPVGFNTRVTPRMGAAVGFPTLKALADGYDVLRIMIERVKDKVVSQDWSVVPKDEKGEPDARCAAVEEFLAFPDRMHSFDDWTRMLLEQVIVYDAPAVWLRPTRGGELYSLEIIDGSMIQPKIMADGRLPPPDVGPAYQQVIKGLPAVDYVLPVPKGAPVPKDPDGFQFPELLYKPRNPRVDSVYGFGAVEQIITTVNIALRREAFLLSYYTDGSTPDLLLGVPETWNPDQIAKFQIWWDSVLNGNLAARRGARFIPGGITPFDTKEKALTDATDEWLTRIMCFAMGLNPMPFLKQMNKGQEKTHHDEAAQEGLEPWLEWMANLINTVILLKFGYRDIEFRWREDEATDELERAQIDKILVDTKVYHPDEIRAKRGDEPMPAGLREQMDLATFAGTVNATVLPPEQQDEADARAQASAEHAASLEPGDDADAEGKGKPGAKGAKPAPGVAGKALGKGRAGASGRSTVRVRSY